MPRTLLVSTLVLTACSDVVVETNISYDDRFDDDARWTAIRRRPPPRRAPAVVVIHGGGWRTPGSTAAAWRSTASGSPRPASRVQHRLPAPPDGGRVSSRRAGLPVRAGVRARACRRAPRSIRAHRGARLLRRWAPGVDARRPVTDPGVAPDWAGRRPDGPGRRGRVGGGPRGHGAVPRGVGGHRVRGRDKDAVPERTCRPRRCRTRVGAGAPPYLFIHGDQRLVRRHRAQPVG